VNDLQQEALSALQEVWSLSPEVRLGQLMAHLDLLASSHLGKGLGDIEDDELVAILYRHRGELLARLQGRTNPLPPESEISVSGSSILPAAMPSLD